MNLKKDQEDRLNRISTLDALLNRLTLFFSKCISDTITRDEIFYALYLTYHNDLGWEHPVDFWSLEVTFNEAKSKLEKFDWKTVVSTIETSENLVPKEFLVQTKVQIKSKGLIWRIHKYDADPFPSNPHAHLIESGIKLDLSNGKCYKKKLLVHTIKRKDLLRIREEASKNFNLPQLEI